MMNDILVTFCRQLAARARCFWSLSKLFAGLTRLYGFLSTELFYKYIPNNEEHVEYSKFRV
jgi:hypothetical protein